MLFLQLKLAYQDDTPVQDSNGFITVSHGFSHNQEEYNKTQDPVPRNGILELNFYPPVDENVHTLGIEVSSELLQFSSLQLKPDNGICNDLVCEQFYCAAKCVIKN